jgi:hypothetical protein
MGHRTYTVLIGKLEGKRQLAGIGVSGGIILKIDPCDVEGWIQFADVRFKVSRR